MSFPGEPTRQERKYYDRRIRIASAYKRQTGGQGFIDAALFGDDDEFVKYTRHRNSEASRKAVESNFKALCRQTRRKQLEHGGTYGVLESQFSKPERRVWEAYVGNTRTTWRCAIAAAIHRNKNMAERHPGHPEFLVDIDAAWAKWGCVCGEHKKPEA